MPAPRRRGHVRGVHIGGGIRIHAPAPVKCLKIRRGGLYQRQKLNFRRLIDVPHIEAHNAARVAIPAILLHGRKIHVHKRNLAGPRTHLERRAALVGPGERAAIPCFDFLPIFHEAGKRLEAVLPVGAYQAATAALERTGRYLERLVVELVVFLHHLPVHKHAPERIVRRVIIEIGTRRAYRLACGVDIEPQPGTAPVFHTANADNWRQASHRDALYQRVMRRKAGVMSGEVFRLLRLYCRGQVRQCRDYGLRIRLLFFQCQQFLFLLRQSAVHDGLCLLRGRGAFLQGGNGGIGGVRLLQTGGKGRVRVGGMGVQFLERLPDARAIILQHVLLIRQRQTQIICLVVNHAFPPYATAIRRMS